MEEGETVSILPRKELRKQKLMEYLAAKGKLKQPNPKPYLRDDSQVKKPVTSALKVVTGKENKAPAQIFSNDPTKTTKQPARMPLGVTNKSNVKDSILTGRKSNRPPATTGQAQPNHDKNLVFTRMNSVVSSKSRLNAASHLKKRPNTGAQSLGKASSYLAHTAMTKSNSRFGSSSNAASSLPVKTVSSRLSLGPVVKTKTGLIPAVTQPINGLIQNLTQTSTKAANKCESKTSLLVSVSTKSAKAQRKTLPTTALIDKTTVTLTARDGIKVQDHNKSNSRPLLSKHSHPSCKSQLLSGLKSMSSNSNCTAAPIKPLGRVGMSKTNQSAGPTTKLKSEGEGEKNRKHCRVHARTSSGQVGPRCSSRVMQAAMAELGGKPKTCKETDSRKGQISANAPPPKTGIKRTGASALPQTVPRPARTICYTGQATDMKTPKFPVSVIPHTEGKKLTAVQVERMRKLQEWREAKGISYKRPPMPVKPQVKRTVAVPQPFWTTMNEEDEAHSLICAVDRSLVDCIKLLGEGCPPDQVKEVLSRLPAVSQKFAKYWICQARLMEQEGNLDVLPMFEKAVGVVLEPVDELRTVVFEILKKKDEIQESDAEDDQISIPESNNDPMMTPNPARALICGERGDSSVVKYKITATPGGLPNQQKGPARVNGQEVRFFTPVRRSVRIERASLRYPASLQDHDLCVASYNDLISEEERREEQRGGEASPSANSTPMYVYRQNEALQDKVLVQLVYDEGI
ncbi:cytoskeleton-associated protein 2-like [Dicentrarchus labrax]|uniref:Cytoskeleton associated protein 2-like n=1 Tax=Dicentrarchus labrax TaxID=13489 RepID=A0A8P4GTX9_DICLA|nr:cytoskeleton-associated protein 2-like [Dicentrarchus labrax]